MNKQETLEEAKRNYLNKCVREQRLTGYCDEDFENGAKWHEQNSNINALNFEIDALKKQIKLLEHNQQIMYNEEDMRKMYDLSCGLIGLKELHDQTENNQRFKDLLEKVKNK
jgi:hypothetical protein